jgi:hypothetical protein
LYIPTDRPGDIRHALVEEMRGRIESLELEDAGHRSPLRRARIVQAGRGGGAEGDKSPVPIRVRLRRAQSGGPGGGKSWELRWNKTVDKRMPKIVSQS